MNIKHQHMNPEQINPEKINSGLLDAAMPLLDVDRIRKDFPILKQTVNGQPLVYLDNAATSQKPQQVIDAIHRYYTDYNANVHRGVHCLSEQATQAYEHARSKLAQFINAEDTRSIVFVRGTTEAINLVAQSYGRTYFKPGDEILITEMEHHSNIVPWQLLCEQTGAVLRVVPINDQGELCLDEYFNLLNHRTQLLAITHISNALGTINPLPQIIEAAHAYGVKVLVDGAQAAPHCPIDVQALDCDFYTLSGHKMYGPTGIGALYAKLEILQSMPPYQAGGEMIRKVSFDKTEYADAPARFEAGTPNIAGVIGLSAALDYINHLGVKGIAHHEQDLLAYATQAINGLPGIRVIGSAKHKAGILSFTMDKVHAHDIGTILDSQGIAVRVGHHCAMPVMEHFGIAATTRASFAVYNTRQEIDALLSGLQRVNQVFNHE